MKCKMKHDDEPEQNPVQQWDSETQAQAAVFSKKIEELLAFPQRRIP
jgi:hypothetical protein